jgi:1-acyl-sn-glycerol-3-phosphate acyltransferase
MRMSAPPPLPVQFQGSALAAWVLRLLGWRLHYHGFAARQGVAIVYPHTSNWDFPVAVLAKWAIGVQVRFWGKDSLFRIPLFGAWLRWLGGVPLDRSTSRGAVGEMVAQFEQARQHNALFWLALSPEGTRKYTPGWRSGYYQVALRAKVPIMVVKLDVANKCIDFSHFVRLTGRVDADHERLAAHCEGASGFKPQGASPVRVLSGITTNPKEERP